MLYYMAAKCKVSIIGGGFKPPHLGHLTMIFGGVSENNITVLAVGCGNRDGITRRLSKDILKVYLDILKNANELEYEETLFGFIILNKKKPVPAESGGERDNLSTEALGSIKNVYDHLQSVLMGVSPEELLDSLIMDELHVETIQSLINRVTSERGPKNDFIEKKSKSPIGLTFYLFQILEEYVKVDETKELSLHYYVGDKDAGARKKIFSRFERKTNPRFQTHPINSGTMISGTATRDELNRIVETKQLFSDKLFEPLVKEIGIYKFPMLEQDHGIIDTVTESVMASMKKTSPVFLAFFVSRRQQLWLKRAERIVDSRENSISSTVLSSLGGKMYATSSGGDGSLAQTITSDEDIFNMLLGGP